MGGWTRPFDAVGARRAILCLGVGTLVLAISLPNALADEATPPATVLIRFLLIAVPGFVLVFGTMRLPRWDVHPEFYGTVAAWTYAGPVVMAVLLVTYQLQPTGGIVFAAVAVPILLAHAAAAGFAVGVHDAAATTRQRELERTHARLEATVDELTASNERLEQFAHAVSHDLQEPLRMVSTYLQLVESRAEDELSAETREHLEFALEGAERMRSMIEGLLAYSRVETEAEPLQPVDLEAVLEEVRDTLRLRLEDSDATLEVGDLPTVRGDPRQLRQVFQNLLDNAVEYSGDEPPEIGVWAERWPSAGERTGAGTSDRYEAGARETLRAGAGETLRAGARETHGAGALETQGAVAAGPARDRSHGTTSSQSDDWPQWWRIAVQDRGIGIPEEHREDVFEVFERLHGPEAHEGSGVGLALCQRIVDRHGGDVWIDSELGEGTTVSLTLPDVDATAGAEGAESGAGSDVGGDTLRAE